MLAFYVVVARRGVRRATLREDLVEFPSEPFGMIRLFNLSHISLVTLGLFVLNAFRLSTSFFL
jgi:hypothetical protein